MVLMEIWNDVGANVGGALVLAKEEEPITIDTPLLTP